MDDDLHALGEDLITTAARVVRWVPKENGFGISFAAAQEARSRNGERASSA